MKRKTKKKRCRGSSARVIFRHRGNVNRFPYLNLVEFFPVFSSKPDLVQGTFFFFSNKPAHFSRDNTVCHVAL